MTTKDPAARNRSRKAFAIAQTIWDAFEKLPANERPARLDAHMTNAPQSERDEWASVAGQTPPRTSWPVVIDCLRIREDMRAGETARARRASADFQPGDVVRWRDGMEGWRLTLGTVTERTERSAYVMVRAAGENRNRAIRRDWLTRVHETEVSA